jgi:hypothetical protein
METSSVIQHRPDLGKIKFLVDKLAGTVILPDDERGVNLLFRCGVVLADPSRRAKH